MHIEREFWASDNEAMLGIVAQDVFDADFGWAIFLRDEGGRFRAVRVNTSLPTLGKARSELRREMVRVGRGDLKQAGRQGGLNFGVDLLAPVHKDKHPYFDQLLSLPARAPARAAFREIGPWLSVADPHFVREFQTTSFDQRLWEIYLWCALRDAKLELRWLEAPDLLASSPIVEFGLEATVVSPSTSGPLATVPALRRREDYQAFLQDFMPMKFGSSLTSKLNKVNARGQHYWEREHIQGKPFLLAVADFHRAATPEQTGSMTFTEPALWSYLYGLRVNTDLVDGMPVVRSSQVRDHSFNGKTIPSGFFDLPGAENVSGVLFSNAGTIAKFDRMGALAGFAEQGIRYLRSGLRHNRAPGAVVGIPFSTEVASPYTERWSDELQLFHNPNAKFPLNLETLPGIAHHTFVGENLLSLMPKDRVLNSVTMAICPKPSKSFDVPNASK